MNIGCNCPIIWSSVQTTIQYIDTTRHDHSMELRSVARAVGLERIPSALTK